MTVRFNVKQVLNGEEILNTFHYQEAVGSAPIDPDEVAQKIAQSYATHLVPRLSDQWSLTEITYVDPDAGGGQPALPCDVPALPLVGAGAFPSMSNRSTCLINWKSNTTAPWKGRTNISGFGETAMENGNVFNQLIINDADAFADDMYGHVYDSTSLANLVIYGRPNANRPNSITSLAATHTINPKPRTVRSRSN